MDTTTSEASLCEGIRGLKFNSKTDFMASVLQVEVSRKDNKTIAKNLDDVDIMKIWVQGLELPIDDLPCYSTYRHSGKLIRIVYKLPTETNISKLIKSSRFIYERRTNGIEPPDTFKCKLLDLGAQGLVSKGDQVRISIKYTNQEVPIDIINEWVSFYGEIIDGSSRFIIDSFGLNLDEYEAEVKIRYPLPGCLPLFGKCVSVYYAGMPRQCFKCYKLGHIQSECRGPIISWEEYIQELRREGIPDHLFGSWIEPSRQLTTKQSPGQETDGSSQQQQVDHRQPHARDIDGEGITYIPCRRRFGGRRGSNTKRGQRLNFRRRRPGPNFNGRKYRSG